MWRFLGLMVLCSLASPLQGEKSSPGILCAVSPAAVIKYVSTFCLQNHLMQSHILAIQFPDIQPKGKLPENWISELHIVKVFVPAISVELQGKTADSVLCVKVRLHLSAKFFSGKHYEQIDILVDVDVKARLRPADFFMGTFAIKCDSCQSEVRIAKIICPLHLLVKRVRPVVTDVLTTTLPKSLCQVVELVAKLAVIDFLYTSNVLLSMGTTATVHYRINVLPLITSNSVTVELKMLFRTGGRIITLPISSDPLQVPVLRDHRALCMGMTQASMRVILTILVRIQPQEFICTPEVFSGAVELTNTIAGLLSHQKCPKCPATPPLKITLTVIGVPAITLAPKRTVIEISIEIAMFAKGLSGAITGLFIMRANLKLSAQVSVHDSKLILSTELASLELILVSSDVGPIDVSGLVKIIQALLVETLMPHINECLSTGVPLPSLLHIRMAYPVVEITQGMLVLCV